MKQGRPTDYNEEITDIICEEIATGAALYKLCKRDDMPGEKTVYQWLEKFPSFAQKYARARERQQDYESDHIVEIADNAKDAQLGRLQVDARKWRASKLHPKKYGDKTILSNDPESPIVPVINITLATTKQSNDDSSDA